MVPVWNEPPARLVSKAVPVLLKLLVFDPPRIAANIRFNQLPYSSHAFNSASKRGKPYVESATQRMSKSARPSGFLHGRAARNGLERPFHRRATAIAGPFNGRPCWRRKRRRWWSPSASTRCHRWATAGSKGSCPADQGFGTSQHQTQQRRDLSFTRCG
jgi:hypothetical protein